MGYLEEMAKYQKTEKQEIFGADFLEREQIDVLTIKLTGYDKWVKRGKYYMRYLTETYDQNGTLKGRGYATLILPKSREDVLKFVKGEHALEA